MYVVLFARGTQEEVDAQLRLLRGTLSMDQCSNEPMRLFRSGGTRPDQAAAILGSDLAPAPTRVSVSFLDLFAKIIGSIMFPQQMQRHTSLWISVSSTSRIWSRTMNP